MSISINRGIALLFVFVLTFVTPVASETASEAKILNSADVCDVALSVLIERLEAARDPDQRGRGRQENANWSCYAPMPGHPTAPEKSAYIEEISAYAKAAETKFKVPAAALAAMAILESGYGFTRVALPPTNNLFGWKLSQSGLLKQGGYVLSCQDTTGERGQPDANRCYRNFASRAASFEYIAGRLASGFHSNYRKANDRYQRETRQGVPVVTRVQNWVAGIASPYNWRSSEYTASICRLMRNPTAASDQLHPKFNLYQLSAQEGETTELVRVPTRHVGCTDILPRQ